METINAEIFTMTYGSIVRQLITDLDDIELVNKQLDAIVLDPVQRSCDRGYNIGIRLIDEFLAKSKTSRCGDFKETAEKVAKLGFKMFLNTSASVTNWNSEGTECSLVLDDNPLVDFVELPEGCQNLCYCQMLCGVIRGALEMVNVMVECAFVKDVLKGDDAYELRLKFLAQAAETYPYRDED